MIGKIIGFITNLFFGGKKKEEVKKLDKAIKVKNEEVTKLEEQVVKLEKKKKVNKKEVGNLKRKVTNTKKQIAKAEEAVKTDNVDDAVKYLKKFSKQYILIYMRYFIYILFLGLLFGQDNTKTFTFSEEEVLGFTNKIKELELKDSLNVSLVGDLEKQIFLLEDNAKSDSLIIDFRTQQLQLQTETINLYKEKIKVVKPKWHENKWLWFVYGVAATSVSVKLAGELN